MRKSWVFLRSAIAYGNERFGPAPSPNLQENDDMWTHLFARLVYLAATSGTIFREGNPYWIGYRGYEVEDVRVTNLASIARSQWGVIFVRGAYAQYRHILESHPEAFRVYIGCGSHYDPSKVPGLRGLRMDLILVDTLEQKADLHSRNLPAIVFHKPAADNVFLPVHKKKLYDVVWICRSPRPFKGGEWLAKRIPKNCRLLHIGPNMAGAFPHVAYHSTGIIPRKDIPYWASRARIGVVCDDGQKDSGPRILPELLAMDIPALVRRGVRSDLDWYISTETGRVIGDDEDFGAVLWDMMLRQETSPAMEYQKRMSLDNAAFSLFSELRSRCSD